MSEPLVRPLEGRGVLVTGASSGIGRAIAIAAARAGADVALTYRSNATGARETEAQIRALGRRAVAFQIDLADGAALATLGASAHDGLGRLDAWINNAGADILTGPAASMSDVQKMDLLLSVDLRGTILTSWQAAETLAAQPDGGVIINMSWDHVLTGMPGTNPQLFAAVKGGVLAFSKALARSVAPAIRVNVIAPGWIETSFGEGVDEQVHRSVAESTPLKRWGQPEDVAYAILFLASDESAHVSGANIPVDGGAAVVG